MTAVDSTTMDCSSLPDSASYTLWDGEISVSLWSYVDDDMLGSLAQSVNGQLALFCVHEINQVNVCNCSAPEMLHWLILALSLIHI